MGFASAAAYTGRPEEQVLLPLGFDPDLAFILQIKNSGILLQGTEAGYAGSRETNLNSIIGGGCDCHQV